jgi:uncharacterized RDD family membrane protein YckC
MPDWQPILKVLPTLIAGADAPQVDGVAIPEAQKDMVVQQMREGVPTLGTLEYGGFWMRFLAKFIDYMVVNSVMVAFTLVIIVLMGMSDQRDFGLLLGLYALQILVSFGLWLTYSTVMVGKYGATLGKMALGLKVVRPDGSPVSMGLAAGRYLAEILSGMILGIGYLMVAFDEEKRALHDQICGTRVVVKR